MHRRGTYPILQRSSPRLVPSIAHSETHRTDISAEDEGKIEADRRLYKKSKTDRLEYQDSR